MIKPAIVVVGYNRVNSMARLLQSIKNAYYPVNDITLIISLDKGEKQNEIKLLAENFQWEHGTKEIKVYNERQGLKKHIIKNGNLALKYGAIIVLEDDLYVAPDFYNFAYQAVNYYKNDNKVVGIGLYSHEWNGYSSSPFIKRIGQADVFAGQFSITWGQCWTKRSWQGFYEWLQKQDKYIYNSDIPERINRWSNQSWGKYFVNYIQENNLYYIIPNISLSTNFSDVGQHSKYRNTDHQVSLWLQKNKQYVFLPFDKLFKYDLFFEPILEKPLLGISRELIDVDLNMTKKKKLERRYLLTTKKRNYRLLKSYSLDLRPIELNILQSLEGDGIYFYDTQIKENNKHILEKKLFYDLRGYNFIQLFKGALRNFKIVFFIKSKLWLKKWK